MAIRQLQLRTAVEYYEFLVTAERGIISENDESFEYRKGAIPYSFTKFFNQEQIPIAQNVHT